MKFIAKVLFLILFILKVSEQLLTSSETDSSSAENYDITHPLNETIVEIFQSVESENVQRLIKTIENKEVLSEGPFTCENITATFDSIQLTYVHAEATRISYEFQEKKILTTSLEPMFKQFLPLVLHENMNRNEKFVQSLNKIYDNLLKTRITSKHRDFHTHEYQYHYLIPIGNFAGFTLKDYTIAGLSNFQSFNFTENPLTYILQIGNIRGSISLFNEIQAEGSISQLEFRFDSLSISVSWETNRVSVAARNYTVISTKFQQELDERHAGVIVDLLELCIASSILPSMDFQRTMRLRPSPTIAEMETTTQKIIIETLSPQLTETTTIKQIITETSPHQSEETTTIKQIITETSPQQSEETTTIKQIITETTSPQQSEEKTTITITTTESPTPSEQLPQNESLPQDDQTTTEEPSTPLQPTKEQLDYFISFNDVKIKLMTSDQSYPEQVQCELLNNLKFAQSINVLLDGKNNSSDPTGIKFHANVSSVNISIIKSNTSQENDSCHFQIQVNQIIDVTSSPSIPKINIIKRSLQQLKMNEKIEAVLTEIVKKRDHLVQIVRPIVKPAICSSLDVCSQSAKMVKEYFTGFVDKVLKKCSLQRKTNTTVI
ncbi:uncharacterized protein LOC135837090 isoform X2 [Planococcus citri]|uniref:uncharacterized protein LOC135837090 isoform X2 n=1 Tax=Planococcus citri TaxID=170843 RepID=UPI0031F7676B